MITIYSDRLAFIGSTESGKSELARYFFEQARCRRVLIDPKHSWRVDGVKPARHVADVDWRAPVIHVQPPWRDEDFSNELYGAAFKRLRHAYIWTDEADGVSSSSWRASMVDTVQAQGRELEIGHGACFQRPVGVARELTTEATHLFIFGTLDDDDLKLVRRGAGFLQLEQLRELVHGLPRYGYVWIDRRAKTYKVGDPLPAEMRQARLVHRRRASS